MRFVLRLIRRLLLLIVLLLVLAGGGGAWLAWQTMPDDSGAAEIPDLENPVTITFDVHQVPTIRARSPNDAAAALGYLHARERLFQMDLMRRGASGRLSELLGERALRADRLAAALDLPARAGRDYQALPEATRALLDAYARGVNIWIRRQGRMAAFEFAILGEPRPWTAVDSLLWGKAMGLFLANNFRTELARLRLAGQLPRARIEALWPRDTSPGRPYAVAPMPPLPGQAHLDRLAAALPEFPRDAPLPDHASNAWTVGPAHSASGAPLLANDPHLAFTFPAMWYLARIELPALTIVGATAPGVPMVVLGQSFGAEGGIAWGFTTTHGDSQDIFIERITPGRPDHYDTPDGPLPFAVRDVTIPVRFADPVRMRIRETRHGPVLSDLDPVTTAPASEGHVLAVAMAMLAEGDSSATGLLRLGLARNLAEAEAALRLIVSPMQNVMVADRTGAIGMFVVGRVPIRRSGDGAWPVAGWDGAADWTGFAPWEALPHVRNPPGGRIANANNRIVPDGFTPLIARDWYGDWRFRRIIARLSEKEGMTAEDFAAIQTDAVSLPARELGARLAAGLTPADARAEKALALLARWDGAMAIDRPEPLIWTAWVRRFLDTVLGRAGVDPADWRENGFEFLRFLLEDGAADWCSGDCTALRQETLELALAELAAAQGGDPAAWRWGLAHQIRLSHPALRLAPALARLAEASEPVAGDAATVLRAAPGGGPGGFDAVHGAGYRAAYDLADPARSRFALAGGQSGHPFARASASLLAAWARGETFALAPPPPGSPTLVLTPVPHPPEPRAPDG